jgi:hypothetical protein
VQRLNRIQDPRRIPVGFTLRIPRRLLKYEPVAARIRSFRGDVRLIREGRELPLAAGTAVLEGDAIATAANSFASVTMPDDSAIALPSQSRVVVRRLRKVTLTGAVERLFTVEFGRARAVVSPLRPQDEFHISTPIALSAVRGTEFRVRYSPETGQANTETLTGVVAMSRAGDTARELVAGFGAIASDGGLTGPIPLLPAPRLARSAEVQDEAELIFNVVPLTNASTYRAQVAPDAGFLDTVDEAVSQSPELRLPGIADGTWFVRLSAIDANGLEGRHETYSFQRRLSRLEATVEEARAGRYRQYLFRWQVEGAGRRQSRFQLSRSEDFRDLLVDEPGLTANRFVLTDLPSGTYYWRVGTLQFVDGDAYGKWSSPERLVISAGP